MQNEEAGASWRSLTVAGGVGAGGGVGEQIDRDASPGKLGNAIAPDPLK